jgi:hypothetical protein
MKTKRVGPQKYEKPEKTRQERNDERSRQDRTYYEVDKFLRHFRANKLKEHFLLDEGVFMQLCSMAQADPYLAKEIAASGVILLMGVDGGFEIDGLIEIAQVIAEENGG